MDLFTIGLLVMVTIWAHSILFPKKEEEKTIEEKFGEALGNTLKDEDFGKTFGKYLKERAKDKEHPQVNININLNGPKD